MLAQFCLAWPVHVQELAGTKVKLNTAVYTAYIKACGSSPGLVDSAHAAFKKMIWGPRRMKPNQVTFITMMRVLREACRPHQALDVYLGMRRAGQSLLLIITRADTESLHPHTSAWV